ncbi:RNA-guided endonuclease IscB [Azohydromonas aeria]|uniref:RNA-guided endonuclease IscB n=1 Tax=Azohydromonas aeria TaxID=2590212 RepID=UPI0012F8652F|nr:RNA-guided endonuclease IscB [Azohydromonas aeria]
MYSENSVFVLDAARRPLSPCRPAQARRLLRDGKAAVLRRYPFTIILTEEKPQADPKPLAFKIDPGSKATGLALLDKAGRVVFAAELEHRGESIKKGLDDRRMYRRNRRSRKTRYRAPRFDNRRRANGWLPPSLQHRVDTTMTWVRRIWSSSNVAQLSVERVKFDTQAMQNPEVSGAEYQQGELAGNEVREYLLEKWQRRCAYCDASRVPLQIEHVVARSRGGTNRVSNLTLSCGPCNRAKGADPVEQFLCRKPDVLAHIKAKLKQPLKDTTAVNATRWALFSALAATELAVEAGSGARTKFNRTRQGYPKAHWIDAACVGESGALVALDPALRPLRIKACGHGLRQRCRPDKYGFPRTAAPRAKFFLGFQTGDLVNARVPTGKYAGRHTGRIAIRFRPSFRLTSKDTTFDVHPKYLTAVQRADGYAYF